MAEPTTITPALSDALTILGAAGIVIPAFARFRISPVIGFIIVGIIAGPHVLGGMTDRYPWLEAFSISDRRARAVRQFGMSCWFSICRS